MTISLSLPETCSYGFVPLAATPLTVGGYSVEFIGNQWSCGASDDSYSFYLAPYDVILITGPGMEREYRADGVFQVDVNGNLSWTLGVITYDWPTSVLARLSGTALVAPTQDPATLLSQLAADVAGVGTGKSLTSKVSLAQTYYAVPDIQATCAVLTDFVNAVKAQAGKKKLTLAQSATLISDADTIMVAIGCD